MAAVKFYQVFAQMNYRVSLRELLKIRRNSVKTYTAANLAKAIKVQAPFVSRVLNEKAHFTRDHIHYAGEFFKLNSKERELLFLIHDLETTGYHDRRKILESQIHACLNTLGQTEENLDLNILQRDLTDYYQSPTLQTTHMACLVLEGQLLQIAALVKLTGYNRDRLEQHICKLHKLGIISIVDDKIASVAKNLHLPQNDPQFYPWLAAQRAQSLSLINERPKNGYHFTATIAMDEPSRQKLQACFVNFLEQAQKIVEDAPAKQLYHLGFDLFAPTNSQMGS